MTEKQGLEACMTVWTLDRRKFSVFAGLCRLDKVVGSPFSYEGTVKNFV